MDTTVSGRESDDPAHRRRDREQPGRLGDHEEQSDAHDGAEDHTDDSAKDSFQSTPAAHRVYEIGRPFGSSFTDQRPELVSLKKTWPLNGCAPQTMVAFGVYPAGEADLKTAISRPCV